MVKQKHINDLLRNERVEFGYTPKFTLWSWNRTILGYVDKVTDNHIYVGRERTLSRDGKDYIIQDVKRYTRSRIGAGDFPINVLS